MQVRKIINHMINKSPVNILIPLIKVLNLKVEIKDGYLHLIERR